MESEFEIFSLYMIPILIIIYIYFEKFRSTIYTHCIIISFTGIINSIYQKIIYKEKYKNYKFALSIIGHILIILPLIYYDKVYIPNFYSQLLLILILLLLYYIPEWPYTIKRKDFIFIYLIVYVFTIIIIKSY